MDWLALVRRQVWPHKAEKSALVLCSRRDGTSIQSLVCMRVGWGPAGGVLPGGVQLGYPGRRFSCVSPGTRAPDRAASIVQLTDEVSLSAT